MKGNTVSIIGNVTRDAEIRELASGNVAVNFGICWNSSKKDDSGNWVSVPNYFNVRAYMSQRQFDSLGTCFEMGDKVAIVDGHLTYREWEKDGQKRSAVEIVIDDPIQGLVAFSRGISRSNGNNHTQAASNTPKTAPASVYDEDIPF